VGRDEHAGGVTVELRSLLIWSAVFLALELPAHYRLVPWYTLSSTVWRGELWWWPVAITVAVFTFVLLGHLEFRWSVRWLILVAVVATLLALSHEFEQLLKS
jgi:hypothetical protein